MEGRRWRKEEGGGRGKRTGVRKEGEKWKELTWPRTTALEERH